MTTNQAAARRLPALALLAITLLAGCATRPTIDVPPPASVADHEEKIVRVDESSMLPLLGYQQLLAQLSPPELARERAVLLFIPQTPSTQIRLAMLFGQTRWQTDLPRALGLLDKVIKSRTPTAASVHPLALLLASQYQERLRQQSYHERLLLQVGENQRRNVELQDKLDALANIERSLPTRSTGGEPIPGAAR